MKRKVLVILAALIVIISVPIMVFAATSDSSAAKSVRSFFGIDESKLTDQQKNDINYYSKKMTDLQKEFINKMVDDGVLTRAQGDEAIKKIEDKQNSGFAGGIFGIGRGKGGKGGFGWARIDASKLTDKQKSDLKESFTEMAVLEKELIGKLVNDSLLTKTQGDKALQKVDEMLKNIDSDSAAYGSMLEKGMGGFFGPCGICKFDASKLTDQQKADLTDYSRKMADIKKKLINKMVDDRLITKAQGDAAIKRIDDMQSKGITNIPKNMKGPRRGMEKDRFHSKVKLPWNNNENQGSSGQDSSSANSSGPSS